MIPKALRSLIGATLLIALAPACPSRAQDLKQIRISYPSPSICCLSLFAASRWKLFERNGLSVEIIQARSQAANAALMSGDINYVAGVGPNSVVATLRGMPTRAIWFASNKSIYSLISKPDLQTIKDLRHKKIGVSGLGGTAEVSLKIALEAVKEDPKNFVYIGLGGTQLLLPALAAGTVDAVELNPPYIYFAKKQGYRELLDIGSLVEMPIGGLTTTIATLRNKPDEVRRVIRSIQQAKDLMLQQRAKSVDLIAKFLSVDRDSAEDTFKLYKNTVSETGVPTRAGMEQILRAIHMLGQLTDKKVTFSDIADDRIAREVAKELGYKLD